MTHYLRYNLHGILSIVSGLCALGIGFAVRQQRRDEEANRSFFLLTLKCSIWAIGFGMHSLVRDPASALWWLSFSYFFGVPFISPAFYRFSLAWTVSTKPKAVSALGQISAFATALPMIVAPQILIPKSIEFSWGRYPLFADTVLVRGWYFLLITQFIGFAVLTCRQFYRAWRDASSPIDRMRHRNTFIAVLLGYTGTLDFATGFGLHHYPSGYISLFAYVSIIAYTVVRYQLISINVLVRRSTVLIFVYSFLCVIIVPLLASFVHRIINSGQAPLIFPLILLVAVLAIGFSAAPLAYSYLVETAFWMRTNLSTGLVHELKSPVAAIGGSVEILRQKSAVDPGSDIHYEIIQRNADRLGEFIEALMSVIQLQEGGLVSERAYFDIPKLLEETIVAFSERARARDVRIESSGPMTCEFYGDRRRIQLVISNILSNAIKYTERGTVRLSTVVDDKRIRICVHDTGRGIADRDLPRVFDRFFQGKNANKGSGIGLTIAKAWVDAHGGKIWAESDGEGKGTTVTFELPLVSP